MRETPMKRMGKLLMIINILLICLIYFIVVKVWVPLDDCFIIVVCILTFVAYLLLP